MAQRNLLSLLVADKYGVLMRIADAFASRGYNVTSICSGTCEEKNCQRVTIVCYAEKKDINKLAKHLQQVIDVYDVALMDPQASSSQEVMLAKVAFTKKDAESIDKLLVKISATRIAQSANVCSF